MARRTTESVRADIFASFFSDDNHTRALQLELEEQERLRQEEEERAARAEAERQAAPPDFSGVSSRVGTTAITEAEPAKAEVSMLNSVIADILSRNQPGAIATPARALGVAGALADPNAVTAVRESAQSGLAGLGSAGLNLGDILQNTALQGIVPESARISDAESENVRRVLDELRGIQSTSQQASQEALQRVPAGAAQETTETVSDIVASPESFLSVLGPLGAVTAVSGQFGRSLDQATIAGLPGEKAAAYAAIKTSPSILEFLPGQIGKGAARNVDDLINSLGFNLLKRGGAEAATEGVQTAAELGIDKALATYSEDEQIRELAASQVPADTVAVFDTIWRATRAGGVAGTALSTPGEVFQVFADAGKRVSALDNITVRASDRRAARPVEPQPEAVESNLDLPFEEVFPVQPAQEAVPPAVASEVVEDEDTPVDTTSAIQSMRDRLMAQRTEDVDTGVTTERIVNELKGNVTSALSGRVAGLAESGNLEIVDSQDDMPELAGLEQQGKGFYNPDTGKVILVANTVDPENIAGDILSVLSHEVKHAADTGAFTPTRPALRNIVGEEKNIDIINKIDALAQKNTPEGRRAAEVIKTVKENYDQQAWIDEIPANYINAAVETENSVMQNIVSAVRTKFKEVTGNDNVNVKDIKYLAGQLLRESAQASAFTPESQADPFPMIIGPKAKNFSNFAGRRYRSKDGYLKAVTTDAYSTVRVPPQTLAEMKEGAYAPVTALLDHTSLFENYPELRDTEVYIDGSMPAYTAAFNDATEGTGRSIAVSPEFFDDMELGLRSDAGDNLRGILLHELQHAIQGIEGTSKGGNPYMFRTEKDKAVLRDHKANIEELDDLLNRVNNMTHDPRVPMPIRRELGRIGTALDNRTISAREGADTLLSILQAPDRGRATEAMDYLYQKLTKTLAATSASTDAVTEVLKRTNRQYYSLLGEQEAYNVQANQSLPQEELPINPEKLNQPRGFAETRPSGAPLYDGTSIVTVEGRHPVMYPIMAQVIPSRQVKIGDNKVQQSQVKRAAKRLLMPGGGFEASLNEILRHGTNLPASLAIEGTHLGNQLLTAMKRNVANSNGKLTEEGIRTTITERMDKIDELTTRAERQAALDGLDREFPGVGAAINAMRDFKIGFTDEILALRLRDPKPMTKKEEKVYEKMVFNAERYMTRAYLATYNKDVGEQYATRLMKKYEEDPDSKEGKKVKAAIEYLVNNELLIPDPETLHTMPMPRLRRLYDSYFGDVDKFKGAGNRDVFVTKLMQIDSSSIEQLETKALEIVKDMLGMNDTKGSTARALQGSQRQNRTILEARSDMPKVLRELMGEITDPFLRESISLHRMINLVSKTKVLTEIFEQGAELDWWSDSRTKAHTRQLNSINYGPLEGKWITQDVADAITGTVLGMNSVDSALADMAKDPDAISKLVAGAVLPGMHRVMSIQKTWGVVASVANMIFNLGGAIVIGAPTQGIISPAKMVRAMHDTAGTLALEVSDRFTQDRQIEYASELVRAGVTDSATMGEFRSQAYQSILKEIQKIAPDDANPGIALAKAVWKAASGQGKIANTLRQAYAFMDVWTKVATYQDRKQFWTKFNEAEGLDLTTEEIERRAGYEAAGTNISYERAIPLAKILERNIPIAMFLTYFSEVPRALTMSYVQAYRDFATAATAKTAKGKVMAFNMGMSRFIGTAVATAGITYATYAFLDEEDDEEKRKRELDAPWMKNQVLIPIGVDKDGNAMHISLNRFDPWGPFNETIMSVLRAPEGEKPEAAMTAIKDLFVQSKGVLAVAKVMTDAVVQGAAYATGSRPPDWKYLDRKKNTVIERNYPDAYNLIREYANIGDVGENAVEVLESLFMPAVFAPVIDKERSKVAEVGPDDVPYIGDGLRVTGGKAYIRDPDKSLFFRMMDHQDEVKAIRDDLKEVMESSAYKDPTKIADEFVGIIEAERKAFNRLHRAYDGHLAFRDRSHRTAAEALGDRNKKLAARLRKGQFEPEILTKDKLNDWYKSAVKDTETPEEKAELKARFTLMKKALTDTRSKD